MSDKKRIKSWFVNNIILPNNEIIDKPGFIVYQFMETDKNAYMREMLYPEPILAEIESRAGKEFGKKGSRAIYRAGKRWGYRFANGALFPQKSKSSEKDFLGFLDSFSKVIESEYSNRFGYRLDSKSRVLTFEGDNMVICKLSGDGGIFLGAWVGCWAYQNEDPTFEGAHTACQGRGDKSCVFVCGPRASIKGVREDIPLDGTSRIEPEFLSLNRLHSIRSDFSLQRFLEMGNIKYRGGFFMLGKDRLVLNEASSLYFVEDELKKIGADGIIFDSAFGYFSDFAKKNSQEFFIGFLMASGYGNVEIFCGEGGYVVKCTNFPWTSLAKKIGFQWLRGAFSGFLSEKEGRKVLLRKVSASTSSGHLEVSLRE